MPRDGCVFRCPNIYAIWLCEFIIFGVTHLICAELYAQSFASATHTTGQCLEQHERHVRLQHHILYTSNINSWHIFVWRRLDTGGARVHSFMARHIIMSATHKQRNCTNTRSRMVGPSRWTHIISFRCKCRSAARINCTDEVRNPYKISSRFFVEVI